LPPKAVSSPVRAALAIVHDGYTCLIMLQNDGYAYIGWF